MNKYEIRLYFRIIPLWSASKDNWKIHQQFGQQKPTQNYLMWTKKVKVHFDNNFYNGTAKNIPIWNLGSALKKSKYNLIIPDGTTQNIPLWNVHCEPNNKIVMRQFHSVCMSNSSYRVLKLKPQLKFYGRLKQ